MSVVGAYTLHLYCDSGKHEPWHTAYPWHYKLMGEDGYGSFGEYVGETWQECRRHAESDGWKIQRRKQIAICPHCNSKNPKDSAEHAN
jgi:hypothetical protein